ncbi:Kinesin-like protein [Sergentomyia squamirostris]
MYWCYRLHHYIIRFVVSHNLTNENLGGNSKTVMLATISPASIHLEETLATLRYASQARAIVNRVKVNENPHDKIIRELRAEVDRLQVMLQDHDRQRVRQVAPGVSPVRTIVIESTTKSVNEQELDMLRKQLAQSKQELARAQRSWMDRLREAEAIRQTEMETLKRKGLALNTEVSRKEPCLINLDSDPILSGVMVFLLPPGKVQIGRNHPKSKEQPDIVLEGPLVALNHCSMENKDGELFISPITLESETYVNGRLIDCQTQLHHGDRVVFGGSHYFLVSNPHENVNVPPFDFQQAHQEITQEQEKRLRDEIQAEMDCLQMEMVKMRAKKEIVESELEIFKTQVDNSPSTAETYRSGYKSNLVDHLQKLMTHPSDDCLHEIQLHVKEATQRCKDVGAKEIEFRQSQVCDEFGLFRAVVNIVDRKHRRVAEWPPARLDVWLEMMRDVEEVEPDQIFDCMEIEWKTFDGMNESILNESLNSGKRISLNLSGRLGGRTPPSSQKSPRIKSALKNITPSAQKRLFTEPEAPDENTPIGIRGDMCTKALVYLKNIHMTATCLRNLCHDNASSHKSRQLLKMIDQVDQLVGQMAQLTTKDQESENDIPKTPKSVRFRLD